MMWVQEMLDYMNFDVEEIRCIKVATGQWIKKVMVHENMVVIHISQEKGN